MSSHVEAFLIAIDKGWAQPSSTKITLCVIGSTSLLLQTDYVRGTKDSDVLETIDMAPEVKQALLALAGEDSLLAARHRMYLDIVARAIPFLPLAPTWHPMKELSSKLAHFQLEALDIKCSVSGEREVGFRLGWKERPGAIRAFLWWCAGHVRQHRG